MWECITVSASAQVLGTEEFIDAVVRGVTGRGGGGDWDRERAAAFMGVRALAVARDARILGGHIARTMPALLEALRDEAVRMSLCILLLSLSLSLSLSPPAFPVCISSARAV